MYKYNGYDKKLIILDHAHMTIKQYIGHNTKRHAAVEHLDTIHYQRPPGPLVMPLILILITNKCDL